ncbi:MAG: hypothetical protein CMM87_05065 [Rickettsiales bacterium]|nr:hypothetical protein [Rickettsiales bacterium]|tara:strand:- start:26156 stop:27031 length:876 start_codon:yes stop_codon:yes gene_type:complete
MNDRLFLFFNDCLELKKISLISKKYKLKEHAIRRRLSGLESEVGEKLYTIREQEINLTESGKKILKLLKNSEDFKNALILKKALERKKTVNVLICSELEDYALPTFLSFLENGGAIGKFSYYVSDALGVSLFSDVMPDFCLFSDSDLFKHVFQNHKKIIQEKVSFYALSAYVKKNGNPSSLSDLKNHTVIFTSQQKNNMNESCKNYLEAFGKIIEVTDALSVKSLVEKGIAIGALSETLSIQAKGPLIQVLKDLTFTLDFYFGCHPNWIEEKQFNSLFSNMRDALKSRRVR